MAQVADRLRDMSKTRKPKVGKGTFLIAAPNLLDPNFWRSVVLLCEHNVKGSMGIIVNRPTRRQLREVLPEATGPTGVSGLLHLGGPVNTQGLVVLHRLREPVPGSIEVLRGVGLGGERKSIETILGRAPKDGEALRVCLGYAGWGKKQLEGELEAGGWITCPADPQFIFDTEPARIWSDVLWSMGGIYRVLSQMPADASVN